MNIKKSVESADLRINRRIRAREVRVIDPSGQQLGIMPVDLALQKAEDFALDLVEIAPESRPPVCRIMDYGKFKYAQKKKSAEARKNQVISVLKEIKFRPKIEAHDYNFKVEQIKRFLAEGHKAKVTMMFRGREITRQDIARGIMERIAEAVKDFGVVEQLAKLEGRNMIMVIAPGKASGAPLTQGNKQPGGLPATSMAATVVKESNFKGGGTAVIEDLGASEEDAEVL